MNKPRRSSLRLCSEAVKNESLYEANTRRVSFSRTIFVCGAEMEVSQFPLSRVSDESVEITPIDTEEPGQFSPSIRSEQSGHHDTEASGSGLTEVMRPGESQSILSDSSMFHMSIDLDPGASGPCSSQPVSADVSIEMSVSSDITPQKSEEVESVAQPPHSESEIDMSIDKTELACQEPHPSSLPHASELDNLNTPTSWSLRNLISPSSGKREEIYPIDVAITRLPSRPDHLSAKGQTKISCSRTDDSRNKNVIDPITQLSPASDKKTDLLRCLTEKKEIPPGKLTVALQTPLPFESEKRIPQSSSRRLLGSLPPLRSDRLAVQTSNQRVYRTLLGCQEPSSRRQQLVNGVNLQVDYQSMSQSQATTPLRQVKPKDWIPLTILQRSSCLRPCDVSRRYELDYLMPVVSRMESYLSQISHPAPDKIDPIVGLHPFSLLEFFDHNAHVSLAESVPELRLGVDFERILRDRVDREQLRDELLGQLHAAQLSTQCQLSVFTYMFNQRQAEVLLELLATSPETQQLETVSKLDPLDFAAQAHQRFHQCIAHAIQDYREFAAANLESLLEEKRLIISRIRDLEKELDEELCGFESTLIMQKNVARKLREDSHQLKDKALRIKSVLDEISRTEVETKDTDSIQQGLSKGLSETILQIVRDAGLQPDLIPEAPGATELFIPSRDFVKRFQVSEKKNIQDLSAEKASNKFSPADVICLSYDDHIYVIRTLFGLVHVVVTCRTVHTKISGRGELPPFVIKPEHLIIHSTEVTLPLVDLSPVDCAAVHTLAEYVINLCNSREGRSQFCRLVGMTLEKAVWFVECMVSPFFSLAGDLRAIFLSGHYVHLECTAPLENTFPTPGQRSMLHRSATSITVSADTIESKTNGALGRNNVDMLTPPGPITVTVKLCHRNTLTVLTITIVYSSLELDGAQLPDTSVKVLLGHLSRDKLNRVKEMCKVYPGCIYKAIQEIERLLSAPSAV